MNFYSKYNPSNKRVLLIYTGGTIGMGRNPKTGTLEPLDFDHLVKNVHEFSYLNTQIDTYQFNQPIDSSDMTPRFWALRRLRWLCHPAWYRHDGLHSLCPIVHA